MAEDEIAKNRYFYSLTLSTSGENGPPGDLTMEPSHEATTDVVVENPPPEPPKRMPTRVRALLKSPYWNAIASGLKWKVRAVVGWTVLVGAAIAGRLTQTGQLLSLQAAELAVVWIGFSLSILLVPYSNRNQAGETSSNS